jgi:hypothetical protein
MRLAQFGTTASAIGGSHRRVAQAQFGAFGRVTARPQSRALLKRTLDEPFALLLPP